MANDDTQVSKPAPKTKATAGWVFGGLSFIPLVGVLFGVIAIIFGLTKKIRGQVFLGIAGILFTVILYGSLFYFGFVAETGVYADLKIQLTAQLLETDAGQIALYKMQHGSLPEKLTDLEASASANALFLSDPWFTDLSYTPKDNGTFELRSAGPDKIFHSDDDIVRMF